MGFTIFISLLALFLGTLGQVRSDLSQPGGAGHALLFRDNGVVIENFMDLGESELTFEAWVRTSDSCHNTALFSYAAKPEFPEKGSTDLEANHFIIYNQNRLVACHDFEYIDLLPDPKGESCYYAYNHSASLPSLVSRNGQWHHVAVTWTAAHDGLTEIYVDGMRIISSRTGKTAPLKKGGALMLGAEQDCYGGCLDKGQGFNGEMDEVRIWRVARSQEDILRHMRDSEGLDQHPDLAAYWKMNDPQSQGSSKATRYAKDSSGRGNDLVLASLPKASVQTIESKQFSQALSGAGVVSFKSNFAMNQNFRGMPTQDISIEFWARTPAYGEDQSDTWADFISYAAFAGDKSKTYGDYVSLDEAILIQKYSKEMANSKELDHKNIKTAGSISVSINSNRNGMGDMYENWVDFNVGWVDGEWHHVAVTWNWFTGKVTLYFDGEEATPFWVSRSGQDEIEKSPGEGVDSSIAAGSSRSDTGSFVLGARQQAYGGNFSPQYSLRGDMAQVRIWDKVITEQEVKNNMFKSNLGPQMANLVQEYTFSPQSFHDDKDSLTGYIEDTFKDKHSNDLYFGSDAPLWVYSSAPLANGNGSPLAPPTPGEAGHAMRLSDQQVLINRNFDNFPNEAFTVEFWMLSSDSCNTGVPFSYAVGGYEKGDNSLMIGDYNNWVISVMEDEGVYSDHTSGISTTDGKWHHIAVTWESKTGETRLYDNGREVWQVTRANGRTIPSGGSLIIGREQDCVGGCFDSASGAVGDISDSGAQEYGSQDFFGLIDELRIWRRVRTADEIRGSMRYHLSKRGTPHDSGKTHAINPKDKDLVAYYNFDEGSGYLVRDLTGHGHDLIVTQPPVWEVVEYFSVCGNGVLEGLEECDTGNVGPKTGCSDACQVMDGWECTTTSPSVCWKNGGDSKTGGDHQEKKKSDVKKDDESGEKEDNKSGIVGIVVPILVTIAVVGAGAAAFVQRHAILEKFPEIEDWLVNLKQSLVGVRYTLLPNRGLDMEHVDTASPDFTDTMPAPGRGLYSAFPGRKNNDYESF